jgi:hypothetical protein
LKAGTSSSSRCARDGSACAQSEAEGKKSAGDTPGVARAVVAGQLRGVGHIHDAGGQRGGGDDRAGRAGRVYSDGRRQERAVSYTVGDGDGEVIGPSGGGRPGNAVVIDDA